MVFLPCDLLHYLFGPARAPLPPPSTGPGVGFVAEVLVVLFFSGLVLYMAWDEIQEMMDEAEKRLGAIWKEGKKRSSALWVEWKRYWSSRSK